MTTECIIGLIAAIIIAVTFVFLAIYKRKELKTWLLFAVQSAEEELGAKRGQEKLKLVHGGLIQQFPVVGRLLPFWLFSKMVDAALDLMEAHLEKEE